MFLYFVVVVVVLWGDGVMGYVGGHTEQEFEQQLECNDYDDAFTRCLDLSKLKNVFWGFIMNMILLENENEIRNRCLKN